MKILIVHGWQGFEEIHWQKWLFDELKKKEIADSEKKFEVFLPLLPNSDKPKEKEWVTALQEFKPFDGSTVLVGHSLGCAAILRLLESLKKSEKIGKAILVSGWLGKTPKYPVLDDFYQKEFNWKKIREKCGKFIVICGDNDPFHPLEAMKPMAEFLDAELIVLHGKGHINVKAGFGPFPEMLELVLGK